jgi:hypothetical protein
MLTPDGKLVSLCYAGTKQRSAFDHHPDLQWNLLPDRAFAAEGTSATVAKIFRNIVPIP